MVCRRNGGGISRGQQSIKGGGDYRYLTANKLPMGGGHKNIIKSCGGGGVRAEAGKFCRDTTKILRSPTLPSPPDK